MKSDHTNGLFTPSTTTRPNIHMSTHRMYLPSRKEYLIPVSERTNSPQVAVSANTARILRSTHPKLPSSRERTCMYLRLSMRVGRIVSFGFTLSYLYAGDDHDEEDDRGPVRAENLLSIFRRKRV